MELGLKPAPPEEEEARRRVPQWNWPQRSGFLTWAFMVTLPTACFFGLVAPYEVSHMSPAVAVIAALLYVLSSLWMGLASFSDPGTIPPADAATRRAHGRGDTGPQEVTINGVQLTLKYCVACGIRRPPRASHCRTTNRCVDKWDHYCPWIGNSVGRRNYVWFFAFLCTTVTLSAYVCALSAHHLRLLAVANADARGVGAAAALLAAAAAPLSCLLFLYTAMITFLLLLLLGYHLRLISINQTTNENVRGLYDERGNPFDRGVGANVHEALCGRWLTPTRPHARMQPLEEEAIVDRRRRRRAQRRRRKQEHRRAVASAGRRRRRRAGAARRGRAAVAARRRRATDFCHPSSRSAAAATTTTPPPRRGGAARSGSTASHESPVPPRHRGTAAARCRSRRADGAAARVTVSVSRRKAIFRCLPYLEYADPCSDAAARFVAVPGPGCGSPRAPVNTIFKEHLAPLPESTLTPPHRLHSITA